MAARSLLGLAQYAAVLAALAEGHELSRVLEHVGIDPALWPDAAETWSDRLAAAGGTDDDLVVAFDQHLADAHERFGRRLPPLDEDLRAFLDFRRRWFMDADPPAFLKRVGLHTREVARLARTWSNRISHDPALAAQEHAILREDAGELPTVTPVAVELPPAPPVVVAAPVMPTVDVAPEEDLPAFAPITDEAGTDVGYDGPPSGAEGALLADAAPADTARAARPQRPSFLITTALAALAPKPALPFRPGAETPTSLASRPVPHPAAPAAGLRSDTASFEGLSLAAVLPFTASVGAGSEVHGRGDIQHDTIELSALAASRWPVASPPAHGPEPTGTAPMPAVGAAPASASGARDTGGAPAPAEDAARLTLEEYAAFCAELAAFPGEFAETFQRYGLGSPQDGIDLAAAWQERFRRVPEELDTWQRLHRSHLEQCRKQGRPEVKR
jgi:hypothetical protein